MFVCMAMHKIFIMDPGERNIVYNLIRVTGFSQIEFKNKIKNKKPDHLVNFQRIPGSETDI